LANAAAYRMMDDRLEIDNAMGETILTFTRKEEPSIDPALEDTEWILTSLNGRSPVEGSRITLTFAKGSVTGFTGCNYYGGEYTMADEGTLTIPEIAITEQLCLTPKGIMQQEAEYITNLSMATNYRLSAGQLEIFTAALGGVLVYGPVSEEKTSGFEAVFVVAGLLTVTYLLRRRK